MNDASLTGLVVVVAGDDAALGDIAAAMKRAGALVAVVSMSLSADVPATVRFRADPTSSQGWDRIAMHVEQHLGPVDGVISDTTTRPAAHAAFGHDLTRRGRGKVVVIDGRVATDDVVKGFADRL